MKKQIQTFFTQIFLLVSGAFLFGVSFASAQEPSVYIDSNTTHENASVVDASANTYSVSVFGTVTHSLEQKYCDASSLLFASESGVSVSPDANLLSNAQFTVEYWINPAESGYETARLSDLENHKETFPYNLYDFDASGNEWYHVAIVKDGTDIRYYLNGEVKDTKVNDEAFWNAGTNTIRFGNIDDAVTDAFQFYTNGYIEKIRIFSGSALYDGNFTPMQCSEYGALPSVVTSSETASLYIDSNTSDANASVVDSSQNNFSVGVFGSVTHSVDKKYCDASSLFIEADEGITIDPTSNLLSSSQFTLEYWLNPKDAAGYEASQYSLGHSQELLQHRDYFPYNTYDFDTFGNTWYHVAIVKDGSEIRYYLNGELKDVVANNADYWNIATNTIRFGNIDDAVADQFQIYANGYIEKIRIFSGSALYDGHFTPMQCSEYRGEEPTPTPAPSIEGSSDVDLAIQINDGVISVDIVDANGDTVEAPGVGMSAIAYSFENQTTTGILGVENEKIRLSNPTSVATWSVSIAATDGESAQWTDGTHTMDYNDPNGGQLTIDPSLGNILEANGESAQGVSLGSRASFEEGAIGSITLYSANATAGNFSQYDLTNVEISQIIPGQQVPSAYTLSLTLTAL